MLMYLYTMSIALVEVLLLLLVSAIFYFSKKEMELNVRPCNCIVTSEEAP